MQNTEFEYEVRPVVGYEGLYSVSNTGEVFSLNYGGTGKIQQLKPSKDRYGYLYVVLYQDKKRNRYLVHRLVLKAFVPNPQNKSCCDHIDTNRENNHVSNLRWCTRKENQNNPITRKKLSASKQGKKHNRYDHTRYTFRNKSTKEVFVGTQYDFYTKYKLEQSNVTNLVNNKLKSTKGWVLV